MKLWKTFNVQKREDISYYNTSEGFETEGFAMHLDRLIREEMAAKGKDGIMFLCIGTDRSTGDSLGPLVGHMLRSRRLKGAAVIGTLDKPVHAMNLDLYARYIRLHYPDYVVVAIDASVGSLDHVGYATLGRGALGSVQGTAGRGRHSHNRNRRRSGQPGSGHAPERAPVHGDENGGLYLRKHFSCRTIMGKCRHNMTETAHGICYACTD